MTRVRLLVSLVVLVALFGAACSGSSDEPTLAEEEPPTATPTSTPTPTSIPTTTTTTVPVGPLEPLTGRPLTDDTLLDRPALIVKIDNHPDSQPQVGLNQADIVVEELVEGITRLVAVFHSTGSNPVGPIRSGRSSDPDIAANFNRPLFAWSGGNQNIRGEIRQAEIDGKLIDISVDQSPGDYYREAPPRFAPHNLFSNTDALLALAPADVEGPNQIFEYRQPTDALPADATPSQGVTIIWRGGQRNDFVWDAELDGWARFQRGDPHVDGADEQIAPQNVVILSTIYTTSAADARSPEAVTLGSGAATVLIDGHLIQGTWTRDTPTDPWLLADNSGNEILLDPGQTWIELVENGNLSIIDPGVALELLGP